MPLPSYENFDAIRRSADGADVRAFISDALEPVSASTLIEHWHWATISLQIEGRLSPFEGHDIARKVRGALWPVLEQAASEQARKGQPCPRRPACLLDILWNAMGRLPRGRDIPKPWVLRSFKSPNDGPGSAEQAVVQFVLFGLAASYCEAVADALLVSFDAGIGPRRNSWRLFDHEITYEEGLTSLHFGRQARLRLFGPLTLSKKENDAGDTRNLLLGLIDRIEGLGRWHGVRLDCDFKSIRNAARGIIVDGRQASQHSWVRRSSRTHVKIPMRDLRGDMTLRGELEPLAPFLSLLPIVHLGKNTHHGHGWARIEPI